MENLNYTNDAVMLLKDLIAIPSISRNEEKAADKLAEYLNLWHLPFGREGNNLWVGCPDWDNNRPTVMLNAHIDTVKPVSSWTRDPFQPMQEGDMLYGLGANDCGGGLVALLQTYRIMLERPRNYNILWVASAEEEVSGENGFSRVMSKLPKIDVAIVGREEGVNAIYEALEDLIWLRDYKFRKVSPLLGATKMTVTVVEGGTQHNVIPDTLHFVIDVRTNEFYQNEYLFEFLRKKMTKCELRARSFRLHSSSIPEDHPLIRRCIERGMQPFGSPTLSDQALMPFLSFKLGPGDSGRSHSADEFIKISEIQQAIDTYVGLLDGLTL